MREPVYGIQILRAVAASMVVMVHLGRAFQLKAGIDPTPVTYNGTAGVDLFFVISGVVMVHTTPQFLHPGSFLRRRIARIAPLYWLLTLLYGGTLMALPGLSQFNVILPANFLLAFLFLPCPNAAGVIVPPLEQGWTLVYEMFFYGCFALASSLAFRHRIAWLAAGFVLLIAIGRLVPFDHNPVVATYTNPILLEFVLGCVLGKFYDRQAPIAGPALASALITLGAIGLVASPFLMASGWPRVLCWGMPALLTTWGVLGLERRLALGRLRVLRAIGDSSYALYLTHVQVLSVLALTFRLRGIHGWPALLLAPLFLGICLLAGWLCHVFIDLRLTAAARRWLGVDSASGRSPAPEG